MPIYANGLLTSTNATILIDGIVCGEIQDITATETYRVNEFTPLGYSSPRTFVVGASTGQGTIRRAYVNFNILLDKLKPSMQLLEGVNYETHHNDSGDEQEVKLQLEDLQKGKAVTTVIDALFGTKTSKQYLHTFFDIEIKEPSITSDNNTATVYRLRKCVLTSRQINLNTGNIVMLQNISFRFKELV